MDIDKLFGDLKKSIENQGTKERNEFNRVKQDLEGEELKTYMELKKSILEDNLGYEFYKFYNLALLDIIFDKKNPIYNKESIEDKVKCFEFERTKHYHAEHPYLLEPYYQSFKEEISKGMVDVYAMRNIEKIQEENERIMIEEDEDIN